MPISDFNNPVTVGSSTNFVLYSSGQTSLQSIIYPVFELSGITIRTGRQQIEAIDGRVAKGVSYLFSLTGGERT